MFTSSGALRRDGRELLTHQCITFILSYIHLKQKKKEHLSAERCSFLMHEDTD
jgi:hypothetical protein